MARARVVRTVPRGSGGQPGFAAQWQHVGSEGGAEVVTAILRDVLFVSDAPIDQDADGSAHFTCNGYNRPRPVDEVLHSEATVHLAPAAKVAPATRASAAFAVVKQPAASVDEHASSDLGSAVESSDPFAFASFGADPDPVAAVARKPAAEEIKAPAPAAKEVGTKPAADRHPLQWRRQKLPQRRGACLPRQRRRPQRRHQRLLGHLAMVLRNLRRPTIAVRLQCQLRLKWLLFLRNRPATRRALRRNSRRLLLSKRPWKKQKRWRSVPRSRLPDQRPKRRPQASNRQQNLPN